MTALSDLVDGLIVGIRQLNALEVGLDTSWVRALGQYNIAAAQTPGYQHLSQSVAALFGDLVQGRVLADALAGGGDLILGAQWRVGLGQDIVLEAVLNEFLVGQEGMNLDLIDVGLDLGELEQLLEPFNGPVRDTNGLGLAFLVELLHCPPCGLGVLGEVFQDDVLFVYWLVAVQTEDSGSQNYLSIRADLGLLLRLLLCGNRPVDQVEVDVVDLELLQGVLKRPDDILVAVQVVPDLGADENILALDRGVLLEEILDGIADLVLVLVEPGAIQVSVSGLESTSDSVVGLAFSTLAGEGSEPNSGDLNAVAESESDTGRHFAQR